MSVNTSPSYGVVHVSMAEWPLASVLVPVYHWVSHNSPAQYPSRLFVIGGRWEVKNNGCSIVIICYVFIDVLIGDSF